MIYISLFFSLSAVAAHENHFSIIHSRWSQSTDKRVIDSTASGREKFDEETNRNKFEERKEFKNKQSALKENSAADVENTES